ncbi:MAG TPA: hypothetical protein VJN18_25365 [Polyangiaceae bacterium]|nr:hypothetical protein [Polyangiaceae bacterium]
MFILTPVARLVALPWFLLTAIAEELRQVRRASKSRAGRPVRTPESIPPEEPPPSSGVERTPRAEAEAVARSINH